MRLSDPRVIEVLQWWRGLPFWRKFLIAIFHPLVWAVICGLDKFDRQAREEMYNRVFGR